MSDFTRLDELEQLAAFDATVTIQRERSGGITMAIRYKNGGEHIFQSRPTLRDAIDDYIADRRTLTRPQRAETSVRPETENVPEPKPDGTNGETTT